MTFLSSKDNPLIKDTVKLKKSAKHRRKTGMFIAEGLRVCMDAMYSKADIQTLFVTETAADKNETEFLLLRDYCKKVCMVSPEIFAYISDTQTPQGFLCIVKTLDKSCQFDTAGSEQSRHGFAKCRSVWSFGRDPFVRLLRYLQSKGCKRKHGRGIQTAFLHLQYSGGFFK